MLRIAIVLLGTGLLLAASIMVSLSNIMRSSAPDRALRFVPFDAEAKANLAAQLFQARADRPAARQAETLAREALARDAIFAPAYRSLGFSRLLLDQKSGAAVLQFADRISRRDLQTRIWLIENAVSRGDVTGALRHFDIALRTSTAAPEILFPILDNAITDPSIAVAVTKLFAADPPWLRAFAEFVIARGQNAAALSRIVTRLPRRLTQFDAPVKAALIGKLVDDEDFESARQLYAAAAGKQRSTDLVRDGKFARDPLWPPFNWAIVNGLDYGGELSAGEGGLTFWAQPSVGGTVARQLIFLPVGKYALQSTATHSARDRFTGPLWIVRCANTPQRQLATLALPSAADRPARAIQHFVVPERCPVQWLDLEVRGGLDDRAVEGRINSVAIIANG